jgi:type II secretory pathway component PulF
VRSSSPARVAAATRTLIAISDFLRANGIWALALVALGAPALRSLLKRSTGASTASCSVPIIGRLARA